MIPLKDDIRTARLPLVTIALALANVVVYLVAIAHGGSLISGPSSETLVRWGAVPQELSHLGRHCDLGLSGLGQRVLCSGEAGVAGTARPQPTTWVTVFSAMFLQSNLLVLAVSVAFLAIFGRAVEDALGHLRFLCFYVLGGLAALGVQVLVAPGSADPTLGAAGAIAAVLAGYLMLHPRAHVLTIFTLPFFFTIAAVPAGVWAAVWLALDGVLAALGWLTPLGGGLRVAYAAQVGGVVLGVLVVRALAGGAWAGTEARTRG